MPFSLITKPFLGLLNMFNLFKKESKRKEKEKPKVCLNQNGDIEVNIELLDKHFEENVRIIRSIKTGAIAEKKEDT